MSGASPRGPAACAAAIALTLAGAASDLAEGTASMKRELRSAKICGACHGPLKRQWERSAMAHAWSHPVFQAFLAEAKSALGDSIQVRCIACHAPLASVKGDPGVSNPIAREGVTCNFCHNVSAVAGGRRPASYTFDPSNPDRMRGPYDDAEPGQAHGFVYSEIHTRSEFCAACHSVTHPTAGVPIEDTYDDWARSGAARRGARCQTCHMPAAPGKASPLARKKRDAVSAHTFSGPTTAGVLDSAATLSVAVEGGKLKLTVANARAGHALPGGGNSMRSVELSVAFYDASGAVVDTVLAQRYGTVFADSTGRSPVPKWLGRTVVRANPIPADSARVEWLEIPRGAARAEALLRYHFILPEYLPRLRERSTDLSGREPVVMAQAKVVIP